MNPSKPVTSLYRSFTGTEVIVSSFIFAAVTAGSAVITKVSASPLSSSAWVSAAPARYSTSEGTMPFFSSTYSAMEALIVFSPNSTSFLPLIISGVKPSALEAKTRFPQVTTAASR